MLRVSQLVGFGGKGNLPPIAIMTSENGGKDNANRSTYTFSNLNVDDGLIIIAVTWKDTSISGVTVGGQACTNRKEFNDPGGGGHVAIYTFDNSSGTLSGPTENVVVRV